MRLRPLTLIALIVLSCLGAPRPSHAQTTPAPQTSTDSDSTRAWADALENARAAYQAAWTSRQNAQYDVAVGICERALEHLTQVLESAPDMTTRRELNDLESRIGGLRDAAKKDLESAQTAKAQLPNQHEVDDTLGWIYYKKGMATRAIESFENSTLKAPTNPVYAYHLGLAYQKNGDTVKARAELERALKLKPDFEGAAEAKKILGSMK